MEEEKEKATLTCSLCGARTDMLFSSPWSLAISAHRSVFEGDMICQACLRDLEIEETEEEVYTRPEE